jgi:alpha-1,6-mannosyltransferase
LPYPSTFATAAALFGLAVFPRLLAMRSRAFFALAAPLLAAIWVTHPVTGVFLWLGLLAWSARSPRPAQHWAVLALVGAGSLGLALAWPFYPVASLWSREAALVDLGNDVMYDDPLPRVVPTLLGVPWLVVRWRRDRRDPLALLAVLLIALIVYGGLSGHWTYGRLISHAALLLQLALADACASFEERLGSAGSRVHHLAAPVIVALLVGASWSGAVRPIMAEVGRGDPLWLKFLSDRIGRDDVVLTDLDTCWHVPGFGGKVVAYPMRLPFVPDHDQRVRAVQRFFAIGVPEQERREILGRYGVRYLLFPKSHFSDWPARLQELRPLGRAVYSSSEYELLRVF